MDHVNTKYSDGLLHLIEANERYWGGEAEVIRSYWDSPTRNATTDRKWLIHQIYKEYWDGILPPLAMFSEHLPDASVKAGRDRLLTLVEVLHEEVEHFALFADLYRELDGSDYARSPEQLRSEGGWPENDELMMLRQAHKDESPVLGQRAHHFTEGGYCTLFTEGMAISGRGELDDGIARVCQRIYDDEFKHMLLGLVEIDDQGLSDADWEVLVNYTVAQMKLRILMRNAQFSQPVSEERLEQLLAGQADPVKFDFQAASAILQS